MYCYKVKKLIKIVDGDTLDLEIDLGFGVSITQRVRLKGLNAPETRTLDHSEKAKGLASKEWLMTRMSENTEWVIETEKEDKYGRYLGVLRRNGELSSLNEEMLREGLASPYNPR